MLAIPDLRRKISMVLLLVAAATLASCATKDTRLVKDPNEKPESVVPWNKQETWELGDPQLARMNEHR